MPMVQITVNQAWLKSGLSVRSAGNQSPSIRMGALQMVQESEKRTGGQWESLGPTAMKQGSWQIAKYQILGAWKYRLWNGIEAIGIFSSFDECKQEIKRQESKNKKRSLIT